MPGSPVADLLAGLPADFEPRPLPPSGLPQRRTKTGSSSSTLPEAIPPRGALAGGAPSRRARSSRSSIPVPQDAPPVACQAYLGKPVPAFVLANALRNTCEHARLAREQAHTRQQLQELNAIGVRLTAERDTDVLLELILTKAREITRSDAGSIYLVEEPAGEPARLRFKLAQNDSVPVAFTEFTLPISEDSIAGHVALTGETIVLDDAYLVPRNYRFHINRDFDTHVGYRTKSMLVVAMRTPAGEVIGVLQLINCKRDFARRFESPDSAAREALPYTAASCDLAASLASQAAVALENSRLYQSIRTLFEGFVQASVTAIESRDPTTSGHSFRVADLTVALATAVDRATDGPLRHVRFSLDEMREIRYASLLHDFGKVGVREEVLVKAKKLHPWHLDLIRQRGMIVKRGIELKYARLKLERLLKGRREDFEKEAAAWDAELTCLLADVDEQLKLVAEANEPAVLAGGLRGERSPPGSSDIPGPRRGGTAPDHARGGAHPVDSREEA